MAQTPGVRQKANSRLTYSTMGRALYTLGPAPRLCSDPLTLGDPQTVPVGGPSGRLQVGSSLDLIDLVILYIHRFLFITWVLSESQSSSFRSYWPRPRSAQQLNYTSLRQACQTSSYHQRLSALREPSFLESCRAAELGGSLSDNQACIASCRGL